MKKTTIESYIYGRKPVEEALKSGQVIDRIIMQYNNRGQYHDSIESLSQKTGVPLKKISTQKFNTFIKGQKNHQGIIAVINSFQYTDIDQFLLTTDIRKTRVLILDHLQDPHNLGAVIRTAEVAGFNAIIIPTRDSASVNDTVVKTSAGAVFHIPVIRVDNLIDCIDQLKGEGIFIFGTTMSAPKEYYQANFNIPFAVVIGNEGSGMSRSMQKRCDELLKIPMYGKINSLNASVSAAIVIFESVRQRTANP